MACEDYTLNISCPDGYYLDIVNAFYGRKDENICYRKGKIINTNCSAQTALAVMHSSTLTTHSKFEFQTSKEGFYTGYLTASAFAPGLPFVDLHDRLSSHPAQNNSKSGNVALTPLLPSVLPLPWYGNVKWPWNNWLEWVQDHVRIKGNETAYQLTRNGANTPFIGTEPAQRLDLEREHEKIWVMCPGVKHKKSRDATKQFQEKHIQLNAKSESEVQDYNVNGVKITPPKENGHLNIKADKIKDVVWLRGAHHISKMSFASSIRWCRKIRGIWEIDLIAVRHGFIDMYLFIDILNPVDTRDLLLLLTKLFINGSPVQWAVFSFKESV
uniref:SUEL-type lectin domain-containing protein n=1 Tax=Rhodnius prolixus TaxID=13249 RepID=T1HYG9_RHOPR